MIPHKDFHDDVNVTHPFVHFFSSMHVYLFNEHLLNKHLFQLGQENNKLNQLGKKLCRKHFITEIYSKSYENIGPSDFPHVEKPGRYF